MFARQRDETFEFICSRVSAKEFFISLFARQREDFFNLSSSRVSVSAKEVVMMTRRAPNTSRGWARQRQRSAQPDPTRGRARSKVRSCDLQNHTIRSEQGPGPVQGPIV